MYYTGQFRINGKKLHSYFGSEEDVTIPSGVESIECEAFHYCRRLRSVTIPTSVREINAWAFSQCKGLAEIRVEKGNPRFRSVDGVLFNWEMTCLLRFPPNKAEEYTIPPWAADVANWAFRDCWRLKHVTISAGVKRIGAHAFEGCDALERLEIPSSVKQIEDKAFPRAIRIRIADISRLPSPYRPLAAAEFAASGGGPDTPGYESYRKYIKTHGPQLVSVAMEHEALLSLMCREKLITPANTERYVEAAIQTGDTEILAKLMDYQANRITPGQKEGLRKRREAEEEKRMERALERRAQTGIAGLRFARTGGRPSTFADWGVFERYVEWKGGRIATSFNSRVDYLVVARDGNFEEAQKRAQPLGVDVISELRFNDLAGRSFHMEGTVLRSYLGAGGAVTVPDGVTKIGNGAFMWIGDLTEAILPESVTEIGFYAFSYCQKLRCVQIPPSVTQIETSAFEESASVTIRGVPGSEAETFARAQKIPFLAL